METKICDIEFLDCTILILFSHQSQMSNISCPWCVFCRWFGVSGCDEFVTEIVVYEKFHTDQLYRNFSEQISILPLECPVWQDVGESITWYKVDSEEDCLYLFTFLKRLLHFMWLPRVIVSHTFHAIY